MSWICEKCSDQFDDHTLYVQHKIDHQLGKIVKKTEPVIEKEITVKPQGIQLAKEVISDRKPIKLKYVFEGQCTMCGKEVTTLEVDVKGQHFVIGYCIPCHQERASRGVVKL